MGSRGPIPKRSEERRRTNRPAGLDLVRLPGDAPTDLPDPPDPDPAWHPRATDWYLSLRRSGQAVLYQPSDWAKARYVAELMSRSLAKGMPNALFLSGLLQSMQGLLATEGDRRRAGVELDPPDP
ncbi:hypothetical protein [Streptomyces virginiae]|uniref:phage terminase small subunit n=1 Tax=Streptomyces virginiae TaxID=1961 RepID=UPI002257C9BF|nr:hypothetical protein [Streptomyces virginiae]MCX5270977.1 hypothetical protein [Streptomyces virginiae]